MKEFPGAPSQARSGEAGILSQVCGGRFGCAWLGGESCCDGEVFECLLVCAGGLAQWWGGWVGELGQSGRQESVVDGGQEHRGVEAVIGDGVSVGVRYAGDEAAGAESSQVVGDLPGGELIRRDGPQVGDGGAEVLVGESVRL